MLEKFKVEKIDSEKSKLIYAMGASEDPETLKSYLDLTLGDTIRLQDVVYVFRAITSHKVGAEAAMKWLEDNYSRIINEYGNADGLAGGGSLSKYLSTVFTGICNTPLHGIKPIN